MRIDFDEIDREVTSFGLLTLHRYRTDAGEQGYEVRMDDNPLMASHGQLGEVAMAQLAHDRLGGRHGELVVLVGGLGAGHTLRAALQLPSVREVVVVEIGHKVVDWNRRYFAEVNGSAIDDPRVVVEIADLHAHLRSRRDHYHLMLLDVDNGPGWLASAANAPLYEPAGLRDCAAALSADGVMALWAPAPNDLLEQRLTALFADVELVRTRDLDSFVVPAGEAFPDDVVYLASGSS